MNQRQIGKHNRVAGTQSNQEPEPAARAPGRSTLVDTVYGELSLRSQGAAVQRKLEAVGQAPASPEEVQAAATHGVRGAGHRLPHFDLIQTAFGRHDISHVQAHTDEAALQGAGAMGARAFATGSRIAFGGAPDLHTAAHEAAHVVQQRAGVHLKGGVGEAGDAHERHADAVADRVVRGESAERLLDEYAPTHASSQAAVQRRLNEVETAEGTKYIEDRSGEEFERIAEGVYTDPRGDAYYYDSRTHQYRTMFQTMWDPVTRRTFDLEQNGRYLHRLSGQYYRYDGRNYVLAPTSTLSVPQFTQQPPTMSPSSLSLQQVPPTLSQSAMSPFSSLPSKPESRYTTSPQSGHGTSSLGSGHSMSEQPEHPTSSPSTGYGSSSVYSGYPTSLSQTGYGTPSPYSGYPLSSPQTGYGTPSPYSGYSLSSPQTGYGTPSPYSGYPTSLSQSGYPTPSPHSVSSTPTSKDGGAEKAKAWFKKEYSYITFDEKGARSVRSIVEGLKYSSKEDAWMLLDNWNAVCSAFPISPKAVGLDESSKEKDIAKDQSAVASMPTFVSSLPQGADYRSGKPGTGSPIALPSDDELALNLDRYWRGRGGEMGGSAVGRKLEKHGENSGSDLEFARTAFAFARQNRTRWFYQDPNQVVFHNYVKGFQGQVKMAVWDYSLGAMVTFYTVEPSKVGGDVYKYLCSKGYKD